MPPKPDGEPRRGGLETAMNLLLVVLVMVIVALAYVQRHGPPP